MKLTHLHGYSERKVQWALLIFMALFFFMGRSYQVSDSLFTVLLGHSITHNQSLDIKPYLDFKDIRKEALPVVEFVQLKRLNIGSDNERWVTLYPQIPVYLSLPFIAITDLIYPVATGTPPKFNLDNEIRQQMLIAAILAALYSLLVYRVARLWLTRPSALLVFVALTIGSSVTSILSRAIWVDTWGVLLIMLAVHHLAHVHCKKTSLKMMLLLPTMALAFFCKPLYAFSILGLLAWVWLINRKYVVLLIILGAVCALAYLGLSLLLYGTLFPKIYLNGLSAFRAPTATAFFGVLISPSRGIFIFWSWLSFLLMLAPIAWRRVSVNDRPIIWIALGTFLPLIALLSCFEYWFGGVGYGPRLLVPMLPWLSLIAILLVRAWIDYLATLTVIELQKKQVFHAIGGVLVMFAILINIYGMMQPRSFYQWYNLPSERGKSTVARLWDWRDPVWLAGIVGRERYSNPSPY